MISSDCTAQAASLQKALQQIHDKQHHAKYLGTGKGSPQSIGAKQQTLGGKSKGSPQSIGAKRQTLGGKSKGSPQSIGAKQQTLGGKSKPVNTMAGEPVRQVTAWVQRQIDVAAAQG